MSTRSIIIYDTEFWTDEGVMQRHWSGLDDHIPHLIQICAFRVALDNRLSVLDEFSCLVKPRDKFGKAMPITDLFTELTHITLAQVETEGLELKEAIDQFTTFIGDNHMYSYGEDVCMTVLQSCYTGGVVWSVPAQKVHDVRQVFRKADGITDEDLYKNSSGTIASYLGVDMGIEHFAHDARNDVLSILQGLRKLLADKRLSLDLFCYQMNKI